MASKSCTSYLRALRIKSNPCLKGNATTYSRRMFATGSDKHKHAKNRELDQTAGTSVPPVSPLSLKKKPHTTGLNADSSEIPKTFSFLPVTLTRPYTAYGLTEILYEACRAPAEYSIPQAADPEAEVPKTDDGEDLGVGTGWWYEELGLKPTFSTWAQVTMLHLYFLTVRFRNFDTLKQDLWEQHLVDHFFWDAEEKMIKNHRMEARGTRNKYLKDMFEQWRGLLLAYDEGLARGDAVLAAAVWRNVFKADENVDIEALTKIVSWMRGTIHDLDKLRDDEITVGGELHFGSPKGELELVSLKSRMMELPFDRAPGKDLPGTRGVR